MQNEHFFAGKGPIYLYFKTEFDSDGLKWAAIWLKVEGPISREVVNGNDQKVSSSFEPKIFTLWAHVFRPSTLSL